PEHAGDPGDACAKRERGLGPVARPQQRFWRAALLARLAAEIRLCAGHRFRPALATRPHDAAAGGERQLLPHLSHPALTRRRHRGRAVSSASTIVQPSPSAYTSTGLISISCTRSRCAAAKPERRATSAASAATSAAGAPRYPASSGAARSSPIMALTSTSSTGARR